MKTKGMLIACKRSATAKLFSLASATSSNAKSGARSPISFSARATLPAVRTVFTPKPRIVSSKSSAMIASSSTIKTSLGMPMETASMISPSRLVRCRRRMPGGGRMAAPSIQKRAAGSLQETSTSPAPCLCTSGHNRGTQWPIVAYPGQRELVMLTQREQTAEVTDSPFNNLLRRLNPADYALLAPHLTSDETKQGELLYNPGDNVQIVHFPCGPTLVSYMVPSEDGRDVETILVGREGAVGGIVSQGFLPAYTRIVVKFGGSFARLPVGRLEVAKLASATLRNVFARYADCMLAQIFQSTACNAVHSIEQRAAKWIVSAMERTNNDALVPLTHEQLATLLGVGRSYASRVLQTLKAEGILQTRRGAILVRDRAALQARACLCNESVKSHFEEVLRGVYPTEELGTP